MGLCMRHAFIRNTYIAYIHRIFLRFEFQVMHLNLNKLYVNPQIKNDLQIMNSKTVDKAMKKCKFLITKISWNGLKMIIRSKTFIINTFLWLRFMNQFIFLKLCLIFVSSLNLHTFCKRYETSLTSFFD